MYTTNQTKRNKIRKKEAEITCPAADAWLVFKIALTSAWHT